MEGSPLPKGSLPTNFLNELLYYLNLFFFEKYRFHITKRLEKPEDHTFNQFIQTDFSNLDVEVLISDVA
jgi:hypothetical protein